MRPDTKRQSTYAWSALGGAALIGAIVLLIAGTGDPLDAKLAEARATYDHKHGSRRFDSLLAEQQQANAELARTIEVLKGETGMSHDPYFTVPPGTQQPGLLWNRRWNMVKDALRTQAKNRSVEFLSREDLGFDKYPGDIPPDDLVEGELMPKLQLVAKAVMIALSTPGANNFSEVAVEAKEAPLTVMRGDQKLLRQIPITLHLTGGLTEIRWVLHRFSQVEPQTLEARERYDDDAEKSEEATIHALWPKLAATIDPKKDLTEDERRLLDGYVVRHDFPLIVNNGIIDSENYKPKDQIPQLKVTFSLCGMQFHDADAKPPGGRRATPPASGQPHEAAPPREAPSDAAGANRRVRATRGSDRPVQHVARP